MRKLRCPHCHKTSVHELKSIFNDVAVGTVDGDAGTVYETLKCVYCSGITIQRHDWNEFTVDDDQIVYETIYPLPDKSQPKLTVLK